MNIYVAVIIAFLWLAIMFVLYINHAPLSREEKLLRMLNKHKQRRRWWTKRR
jgi:hypothetical protein